MSSNAQINSCGFLSLLKITIKGRLTDFQRLSFSTNHQGPNEKLVVPEWDECVARNRLREMGTSWEGLKREASNRFGWQRSMRSCVGLKLLGSGVLLAVGIVSEFSHIPLW